MKYQLASTASVLSLMASLTLPAIASLSEMLTTSGSPQPHVCVSNQQVKQLQAEACVAKPTAEKTAPRPAVDLTYPTFCPPALPPGVTPEDWIYKQLLLRCLYGN